MEEQTSRYFQIVESQSFKVGAAISTSSPVTQNEIERILCDSGTKVKLISEEEYNVITG